MAGVEIAISVEGLSKSYLIGHEAHAAHETFREMLVRAVRGFGRSLADVARGRQIVQGDTVEEFWALQDVSFEVARGEVIGVIGLNGAGKSTLLKILSRITEPTRGRAIIRGRVASLLEVGTGFHPELTGRENIYLNGAILGMTRAEITAKFDEIVAFSEVEQFLDTPVKRYSSGMYVRLAFAVAAHLEPEILIVDEVLAVGDVAFQRKCLGKMQDVAQHGRTVLFVSHNLPAVVDLTSRCLLLEKGRLTKVGESRAVVSHFLAASHDRRAEGDLSAHRRPWRDEGHVDITRVTVCHGPVGGAALEPADKLVIEIELAALRRVEQAVITIMVLDEDLQTIATFVSSDARFASDWDAGAHIVRCVAGPLSLMPGDYRLTVGVSQHGRLAYDVLENLPGFRVDGSRNAAWMNWPDRPGILLVDDCQWSGQRARSGANMAPELAAEPGMASRD
jgi:lipopolysaccharide transport system ATP-binding protein